MVGDRLLGRAHGAQCPVRAIEQSRCCDPAGAPFHWDDYQERDGTRAVENELDDALQDDCETQYEYELRRGEIEALKARASAGELSSEDEIVPVRRHPLLWELRWEFGGRPFRLYHGEPKVYPRLLLALRYHWKRTDESQDEIEARQEEHMDVAAGRHDDWLSRHPFSPTSPPTI